MAYNSRIEKIRKEANDASAFLVFNHEHSGQPATRYLSGFSGSESVLVITGGENFIFTDGRYFSQTKEECPDFTLVPLGKSTFFEDLNKIFEKFGIGKAAVDPLRTDYASVSKFKEKIKDVSVMSLENVLQKIRMVKDENELKLIEKSVSIATSSFEELLPHIKEGVMEKELARKLEFLMIENGAKKIAFDTTVASGENGAKPHARASDKKIKKGELVTFDFGCFYRGYASDVTRTVAIGEIPSKLSEIYETVKMSQEAGLKAAKAGISGAEIDKICRDCISEKGYGDYFLHGTGHGLGMEVHELPYVSAANKEPLPENSVITIEPGIYIEGIGGVRIEDTIVLKKDGNANLSGKLFKR
ncbi:MAG: aminopeptidase P family protein [Candidatus Liptonbacteria bacterium]|nr:aminopeptidase P family protein [Candidatus Liptonbacteria bacterium]